MTDIIPAILTASEEELVRLAHIFERAGVKRVHLDIMDGSLFGGRTLEGHHALRRLVSNLEWDVHLMVADPAAQVAQYEGIASVKRFMAHVESGADLEKVAGLCAAAGRAFWVARNPDTPLGRLTGLSCHMEGALFMTVQPGAQGRPFVPSVLEDIRLLKQERPELAVMVDGGITPATAPGCAAAGAAHLVVGSFLVGAADVPAALRELHASIER